MDEGGIKVSIQGTPVDEQQNSGCAVLVGEIRPLSTPNIAAVVNVYETIAGQAQACVINRIYLR